MRDLLQNPRTCAVAHASAEADAYNLLIQCRRRLQPARPRSGGSLCTLFVLLVAMGVVPVSAGAQAKTEAPQVKAEATQPKKEEPQKQTEEAQPKTEEDSKLDSVPGGKALGMSILGNQEAPKALVIVPWKSSELGTGPSVSTMLDDSRLPIDKEVFMRMLSYYEVRSETARPGGASTNGSTAAPATAAQRRKP